MKINGVNKEIPGKLKNKEQHKAALLIPTKCNLKVKEPNKIKRNIM